MRLLQHLLPASLLASAAMASEPLPSLLPSPKNCTPKVAFFEDLERMQRFADAEKLNPPTIPAVPDNIDLYIHVIAASPDTSDAYVTDQALHEQVKVLNHHFAPAGFFFTLKNITKHFNNWTLFRDEGIVKKTLRAGDYNALNLYYVKGELQDKEGVVKPCPDPFELPGNLGYCNYPTDKALREESWFIFDGCLVSGDTVPGGPRKGLNTGKMTVHEVGHWFGLMHTFQNDDRKFCDGLGDVIDDTPAQRYSLKDCNVTKDTCSDQPGVDPVHNFMGYTNDACKTEFTLGQIRRMRSFWEYRKDVTRQIAEAIRVNGSVGWDEFDPARVAINATNSTSVLS